MAKRTAKWSEEDIIAAIKHYATTYGEVPAATDFSSSDCHRSARISAARAQGWLNRAARFEEGLYPWPRTVQKMFGSWSAAIRAAGYSPRRESNPELTPGIKPSDAIRAIEGYVRRARESEDADERRMLLSQIADRALSALE